MANNSNQMGNQILTDKENIRRNIRNGLTYKKPYPSAPPEIGAGLGADSTEHPLVEFVRHFRGAGGKYIPCTKDNLVPRLIKIAQGQQYGTLLNTSPNLGQFLKKHHVRHVTAVNPMETVDAALFFSDMLIARTGAIGFTPSVSLYPSIRNLARDIIVVSRERCIFRDMEDALAYQLNRNGNAPNPITEFICPSQPEQSDGADVFTPRNPRFILMMVEESHPQETEQPESQNSNETNHESEAEESDR